ncbi:MAG TPA: UDP-N-acetylmuramoyl-L-alanyl-D-glutamate--2,6-diaminopimelate ligase [Casimicrobiaceae bacterium]
MMPVAEPVAFDPAPLLKSLPVMPARITSDSRRVEPGVAFAAYPGARHDGRAFIDDAVLRGAGAVFWEANKFIWDSRWNVPQIPIEGLREKLGAIADAIYGHPSRALSVIGVTGTNGKTSCTHWIAQSAEACGRRSAVIGTLGIGRVGSLAPSVQTTPDVCAVHETLAQFRDAGVVVVAMEVSSHGLDQGRVNNVTFDSALFTNLSRDHLDYHGTMVAYGHAKARLFSWPGLRSAVINGDDPFGQGLIDAARSRGQRVVSYGFSNADVAATGIAMGGGIALSVATPWGRGAVETPVVGEFNAHNLLGVLAVLLESGIAFDAALASLSTLVPPAGRMQRLGGDGQPLIVVDYAHTPDALEKVLLALRPSVAPQGELICIFGCGGDRDKGKRPQMGKIAATLSDRIVVTTDNARSEDPAEIASAIVHGIRQTSLRRYRIELDRGVAIASAIDGARAIDVVLIAGKGHESYQEANGVKTPFDDAEHAARALAVWNNR